jgi:chaperonin GroES
MNLSSAARPRDLVRRRIEAEEKTAGGIIIPDTAKEKPQEGEVVSVGTGARDDDGKVTPLDVKAGDRILFGKWSGTEVKVDGEDLLIMKESRHPRASSPERFHRIPPRARVAQFFELSFLKEQAHGC